LCNRTHGSGWVFVMTSLFHTHAAELAVRFRETGIIDTLLQVIRSNSDAKRGSPARDNADRALNLLVDLVRTDFPSIDTHQYQALRAIVLWFLASPTDEPETNQMQYIRLYMGLLRTSTLLRVMSVSHSFTDPRLPTHSHSCGLGE